MMVTLTLYTYLYKKATDKNDQLYFQIVLKA